MKKILISLLFVLAAVGGASATIREGYLSYSNVSNEEYINFIINAFDNGGNNYGWIDYLIDEPEYAPYLSNKAEYQNFDSLVDMLMALDAGKIDRMELDQPVADYFFEIKGNDEKYVPYIITGGVTYYLAMGFGENNKWFEPFNEAIRAMIKDKTLLLLKARYIMDAYENLEAVKFENFPDAETVKIAVTGDMPPIDYIAPDGTPAGFNTAMLAEIARRLKINVELVSINTAARAAALASGRVDGIFWLQYEKETGVKAHDTPVGTSITEPYYSWSKLYYVGKKLHK